MKRLFLSAAMAIAVALTVVAQPETEVLGTWKLDASHSRFFGVSGAPSNVVVRFERDGEILRETLTVDNASGTSTRVISYEVNGRDHANGAGEDRIISKLMRDKDSLTLEWKDEGGTFTRKLKVSPDRRTLTITVHDSNPDGEPDDLIVLVRP
ncbi:MAG TPA: hypothetical protein VE969_00340 [Pyrinomonadaceae bacterium]|nr:hypothetical protein [Pyrinomonadaceae bacterium]